MFSLVGPFYAEGGGVKKILAKSLKGAIFIGVALALWSVGLI